MLQNTFNACPALQARYVELLIQYNSAAGLLTDKFGLLMVLPKPTAVQVHAHSADTATHIKLRRRLEAAAVKAGLGVAGKREHVLADVPARMQLCWAV